MSPRVRMALFVLALAPPAAGQLTAPTTRVADCTTSGCHASQMSHEVLHGPTAAGACLVCHVYADEVEHRFSLKHTGAALCNFCHVGITGMTGLEVHEPVRKGECVACHDPHGSHNRRMLRSKTTADLCLNCHAAVTEGRAHLHTPVAQGECLGCHRAHSSNFPSLLVEQDRALCLSCHEQILSAAHADDAGEATGARDPDFVPVHGPVVQGCTACHDHHAAHHPSLLKAAPLQLCASCHDPITDAAAAASVHHSVVTDDRACLNCHSPHTGVAGALLNAPQATLCLSCHDKEIRRDDKSIIASVVEVKNPDYHAHGPVADGRCSDCHNPHGAQAQSLLLANYTESFYQEFDPAAYALCFTCHEEGLVREERTTTATGFRNGDRNLHYVHVEEEGESGRSCRVCHSTHAAASARLLRDTIAFGEWELPVEHTLTETGGGCAAGCHRARLYDREQPVSYFQTSPAARTSAPNGTSPPAAPSGQ